MSADPTPLGIYIHVPFCSARCGYCDFNTYVPDGAGQPLEFIDAALMELQQARAELGDRRVSTVFIGGGTPTLLGADGLLRLLNGVDRCFGLETDAEVTTEANPESVDPSTFRALHDGGFTRVSIGMQSAAPHVLATLDRVHSPGRAAAAAVEAREAGFEHVSLDLIYGTPGESDADWERSLDAALTAAPDHISAYALTIKPGTAMAAAVRHGNLPDPDNDAQARRFTQADDRLEAAGLQWYEISSWARDDGARCRHNTGYWNSSDWWGIGPGAHSHVDGVRWWNVLRPGDYAGRLAQARSVTAGREVLTPEQQALETVMLGMRTREGLARERLAQASPGAVEELTDRGWLVLSEDRVTLSRDGRLFADAITRRLCA
jgi:putative oxygen-independent coproporphyrinogen III oxidase